MALAIVSRVTNDNREVFLNEPTVVPSNGFSAISFRRKATLNHWRAFLTVLAIVASASPSFTIDCRNWSASPPLISLNSRSAPK
ncbi:MAG: hypothetical protein WD049_09790 [Candidatus Paceibacterota bacterium]